MLLKKLYPTLKPKIQGRIHVDEKYVKIGKVDHYDLNAIDSKSKYLLAHLLVAHRTKKKVIEFMRQIKSTCYEQIRERYQTERHKPVKERDLICFVSDKFENYVSAGLRYP